LTLKDFVAKLTSASASSKKKLAKIVYTSKTSGKKAEIKK
jgi:hypothetical protein